MRLCTCALVLVHPFSLKYSDVKRSFLMVQRMVAALWLTLASAAPGYAHGRSSAGPLTASASLITIDLPSADAPSALAANPSTNRLYVAEGSPTAEGNVWIIDT